MRPLDSLQGLSVVCDRKEDLFELRRLPLLSSHLTCHLKIGESVREDAHIR